MSVPVYQCDAIRAIFERLVLHVERKLEAVGCISATLRGAHVPERRTGAPRRDAGQMPSCRVYLAQRAMVNFEYQKSVRKVFVKHQLILGILGTYLV